MDSQEQGATIIEINRGVERGWTRSTADDPLSEARRSAVGLSR